MTSALHRFSLLTLILGAVCAVAWAELPATNPGDGDRAGSTRLGPTRIGGGLAREAVREMREATREPTTQERDDALQFFQTHTPFRFAGFDRLPADRPAKKRLTQLMVERYRRLQKMKEDDSELYDLSVKQIELQDEAMRLFREQRNDPTPSDVLRGKVKDLVNLSLQERQTRINKLEKSLADQKSRLEQDKANVDGLVDQHLEQMRKDADRVSETRQRLNAATKPAESNRP